MHRKNHEPQRPTSLASPGDKKPKEPQLQEWVKTEETHEQLAVGKKTSRSFAETLGFLEEMEKKVGGKGEGGEDNGH